MPRLRGQKVRALGVQHLHGHGTVLPQLPGGGHLIHRPHLHVRRDLMIPCASYRASSLIGCRARHAATARHHPSAATATSSVVLTHGLRPPARAPQPRGADTAPTLARASAAPHTRSGCSQTIRPVAPCSPRGSKGSSTPQSAHLSAASCREPHFPRPRLRRDPRRPARIQQRRARSGERVEDDAAAGVVVVGAGGLPADRARRGRLDHRPARLRPCMVVLGVCHASRFGVGRTTIAVRSTTRRHGAPHTPQHFGGDPARMHGSISFGGNVAKCAPANGAVATVHTDRLFRLARRGAIPLNALPSPIESTIRLAPIRALIDPSKPARGCVDVGSRTASAS
jgi:hypothetical protein